MLFNFRSVPWALPIICGLLACPSLHAETESLPTHSENPANGSRTLALKGIEALKENNPDSALELFMEAHRKGMSKDSLYYFLAEAALSHAAYDTAMAFNLSIRSPGKGPFRESVLGQRYRLYSKSGLARDASDVSDSMAVKPAPLSGGNHEFNVMFSSGYYRDGNYPATGYPYILDLGGFRSEGPQYRNRAQLLWPIFQTGPVPWSAGIDYELIKSYAKDSLDYRTGLELKADNLFHEGVSADIAAEIGNVTGTGLISSYKLESSFLSFSGKGITMVQGGIESEWTGAGENRFSGFWASYYRDQSLATGKGFNYSVSVSGIRVDPITSGNEPLMFVDDVTKAAPVHYKNGTFQDTLKGNKINGLALYQSNTEILKTSSSSQGFLTLLPSLGYSFPLPWECSAEIGSHYVLTVYPKAWEWKEAVYQDSFTLASGDFRGFALNQSDGKYYTAVMIKENGGFQEHYGPDPVSEKKRLRVDNQLGADLSLRRSLAKWGAISLDGMAKRNWSTLAGVTPMWIPKWDMGAGLQWSRGWSWL
ncbi:MAG: hypothetical protein JWO30_1893 [Fibrobacteres bacterium]|nr:hypothetical protein [Fibrobacterota bacterium]